MLNLGPQTVKPLWSDQSITGMAYAEREIASSCYGADLYFSLSHLNFHNRLDNYKAFNTIKCIN